MAGNESIPIIVKIVSSTVLNEDNFECEIRANIHDEESFSAWLKSFSDSTKTNWILRSSVSRENSVYDFSRNYVCQHSLFKKNSKKTIAVQKNKKCQASLKVRIKRNTKYTRCRDPYVKEGLCAILSIKFQHSHHLNVAEAWAWLKRKDATRLTFIEYFNNGLSPADAIHYHEDALLADGAETLADASINPPKHWVYYLHNIRRKNEYGGASKDENFYNIADKRLADLKKEGYVTMISKEFFKIILVSPLMQRVLRELKDPSCIFVDSSSSMDQTSSTVTVLSTETKAGAVPICICLHNGQTEEMYRSVFSAVSEIWSQINSNLKISMIMTDDDKALRNALNETWPNVRLLLCQFHVLQAVWRWLWSSVNNIKKDDRKLIIGQFKQVMYAKIDSDINIAKFNLLNNLNLLSYENAVKYFENLFEKQKDWSFCGRKDVLNRKNNTNNYAEATFRVLKDVILTRLKAYNSLALLDFLSYVLEKHYKVRLLDFAYGRVKKPYLAFQKILHKSSTIPKECITKIEDSLFNVSMKEGGSVFVVNKIVGSCSCYNGCQGAFCIHQAAVATQFDLEFPNCPFLTSEDKFMFNKIALGESAVSADFFKPMMKEVTKCVNSENNLNCNKETNLNLNDKNNFNEENESNSNIAVPSSSNAIPADNSSLIENFELQMKKIIEIVKSNPENESLMKAVGNVNHKLKHINSPENVTTFLHGMSLGYRMKFGKNINVQPTAIARRKSGARKGSKRIAAGRPLNEIPAAKKRKRCLTLNINANLPNAKSHGKGH